MRLHPSIGRLCLAVATAGLTALAFAAPAGAQAPRAATAWVTPSMEFVVNVAADATKAKPVKITVTNDSSVTAVDVRVKLDASKLSEMLRLNLPGADDGCTVAGNVATCTLPELAAGAKKVYTAGLLPGDLEAGNGTSEFVVTTGAANMPTEESVDGYLQITNPGMDLVIDQIDDVKLAPGQSMTVPVRAANDGTVRADGVAVVISTGLQLELPNEYENCEYNPNYLELTCLIDQPVEPGEVFAIDPATPLRLKVADQAPGPAEYYAGAYVHPLSEEQEAEAARKARSGKQLRIVTPPNADALAEEINDYDNWTDFLVSVPKHAADSVAVGATIEGAVGDTKSIKVGIRNTGPADVLDPNEGWALSSLVTLPVAVQAVAVSDRCVPVIDGQPDFEQYGKPNGLIYLCWPPESVVAGKTFEFPFKVKIIAESGAAGSIVVDGGVQDPDTGNNTAPITLNASGGSGGGLPVTGAKAGLVAGTGAVFVVAGVVALVLFRRRRIVTIAG